MDAQEQNLLDIEAIIDTRVDLTPEQQAVANVIAGHIRATLKPEVRSELEAEYAKKLADEMGKLEAEVKSFNQKQLDQWKKDQEPLKTEEIEDLLNQEYDQFTFPVRTRKNGVREFTLVELPQAAEIKFIKVVQNKLVSIMKELSSSEFTLNTTTLADDIQKILNVAPSAIDAIADIVVICLNPFGEEEDVNREWVQNNMSSNRMLGVVTAQVEVNKYRDFFSNGFRLSRVTRTTR